MGGEGVQVTMSGTSRRGLLTAAGAALAASSATGLAACGQAGTPAPPRTSLGVKFDQPVEVAFWHTQTGANQKALQDMVDRFNATNGKRITIKAESIAGGYSALFTKNQTVIAAGTPTDFSVGNDSEIAEYAKGNAVIDLDEYARDGELGFTKAQLDDIWPVYLQGARYAQYGNKLLAFPFTKSLVVMYVNDEVLQKNGVKADIKTWTDYANACQQASRSDAGLLFGGELGGGGQAGDPTRGRTYGWGCYSSASNINAWAYSRGGTMMTADNKGVRFSEAPYVDSFQLVEDLFKRQYGYNPPRQPGSDWDFVSNHMAFIHQSSTSRPFLRKVMVDNGRDKMPWRIVNIPQKDPAKPATVQYGANIAIFKTTPVKQAAAWLFLKFFGQPEQDAQWAITSSYMPVRKSTADNSTLKAYWEKDDPQGKQAFDLIRYAIPEPNIRGVQDTRAIIQDALTAVMEGKLPSRQALEQATRDCNLKIQQAG